MGRRVERRQFIRLPVPHDLGCPEPGFQAPTLLDLSIKGTRIAHEALLEKGQPCTVDLPWALGRLHLSGRIVWTRPSTWEYPAERPQSEEYQSGILFSEMSPQQVRGLAAALKIVAEVNTWGMAEPLCREDRANRLRELLKILAEQAGLGTEGFA